MDNLDYMVEKSLQALLDFYEDLDSDSQVRFGELLAQFMRFCGEARDASLLTEKPASYWDWEDDWDYDPDAEDFWS